MAMRRGVRFDYGRETRTNATARMSFGMIDAGEPDANVESSIARARDTEPLYVEGFFHPPLFDLMSLFQREKFFVLGQKGTGKTAILRNIERSLQGDGFATEYLVFRETILNESDIGNIPFHLIVDKERLRNSTYYHHALKRLFISVLLRLLDPKADAVAEASSEDERPWTQRALELFNRARTTEIGQTVSLMVDSIFNDIADARRLLKLDRDPAAEDVIRLLKHLNDFLLTQLVRAARKLRTKAALIVDELHFAYADERSIRNDALLVRDTVLSIMSINERMQREALPVAVYAGVRSEYIIHPVIASSEVTTKLHSLGEQIGWETHPANRDHPLFEMAFNRIRASVAPQVQGDVNRQTNLLLQRIFANVDQADFIQRTWGKPRDMVRFLKAVSRGFPTASTLADSQYDAAMRRVAIEAWEELKSGLSSFMSESGLQEIESYFKSVASRSLQSGGFAKYEEFARAMDRCRDTAMRALMPTDHFLNMLYMMGVYTTSRAVAGGRPILHSFHRGQRAPDPEGKVMLHFLVAKAFS